LGPSSSARSARRRAGMGRGGRAADCQLVRQGDPRAFDVPSPGERRDRPAAGQPTGLIRLPRPGPSAQIGGPIGDRARRDRIAGPASFTPCRQRAARAGMADDQLIGALLAKLPAAGSPWPAREREAWLTLLERSSTGRPKTRLAYGRWNPPYRLQRPTSPALRSGGSDRGLLMSLTGTADGIVF
jgi:hypothetical protein